jgi:hypothetical protein
MYEEGAAPLESMARRFGISASTIRRRALREGWPPRGLTDSLLTATSAVRRSVIHRLYKAIDTKLEIMERRMQAQSAGQASSMSAADHERDTRAIALLISNFDKVTEIATDADRTETGGGKSADAADLFAEADRFRREVAERLEKLIAAR